MGEIADGLINGDFDFYTGEYIGRGGGIPRTRDRSLPWERKTQKSYIGCESQGVLSFLRKKGVCKEENIISILQQYCEHRKWDIQGKKFIKKVSVKIQEDWPAFASWAGNKIAADKRKDQNL